MREDLVKRLKSLAAGKESDSDPYCADLLTEAANAIEEIRPAFREALVQLEALQAMVYGECPSLLEDHHQAPKIVKALENGWNTLPVLAKE